MSNNKTKYNEAETIRKALLHYYFKLDRSISAAQENKPVLDETSIEYMQEQKETTNRLLKEYTDISLSLEK